MVLINDPSRMNRRITFGTVETVQYDNGGQGEEFVPEFTVWCAIFKRTLDQQFSTLGTNQQDNITVIIRHNRDVNNSLRAKFNNDNTIYKVVNVELDETSAIIRYDTVILKRVDGHGA